MSPIALTLFASTASAVCPANAPPVDPGWSVPGIVVTEELEELYRSGVTFDVFYGDADSRRELWVKNYENGAVAEEMVRRVTALGGLWRVLAIAVDACSDSVSTIPFLALLAEQAPNIELRIVDSDAGKGVMEAHRTPDGRAATPTVLILNEAFEEVGCWVERPADLQAWALDARPKLQDREFLTQKMAWYEADAGGSTIRELVEALEGAAAGRPICVAN
jgi:hypothetical protein